MKHRRKKRPNWPYRLTWLAVIGALALYLGIQTLISATTFGRRSYGTDWGLALVGSCLDATVAAWFVAVGASIGSFLNVVAYRLPLGRNIGGHSGCPYCQTPIEGMDNVPVLAWVKLRGRCRTCRLPISIQYPLVELGVAIIFLFVYITEFSTGGGNLPGSRQSMFAGGLMRVNVTQLLAIRTLVYLFALSGLVAAALIAVKKRRVPMTLYAWSLAPLAIASAYLPEIVIVRWRAAQPVGPLEARLDALTTLICGAVASIAVARVIAPLIYKGFDRSLMNSDPMSSGARQFVVGMGLAGAILGWQAVVPFAWVTMICCLVSALALRFFRARTNLWDVTIWLWLGLLIFRGAWKFLDLVEVFPSALPEVIRHVLGALLLAPLALVLRYLTSPSAEKNAPPSDEIKETDDAEVQRDSRPDAVLKTTDSTFSATNDAAAE